MTTRGGATFDSETAFRQRDVERANSASQIEHSTQVLRIRMKAHKLQTTSSAVTLCCQFTGVDNYLMVDTIATHAAGFSRSHGS